MNEGAKHRGGCLCGAVSYETGGPLRPVVACHCGQCRKTSGHHVAATNSPKETLKISGEENLTWFESSPGIFRGFCRVCGSNLFWNDSRSSGIAIMAGSLEAPTGLALAGHIYTADKGDYYEIADGLPAFPQSDQP